jgi:hypothetical protein
LLKTARIEGVFAARFRRKLDSAREILLEADQTWWFICDAAVAAVATMLHI